MKKNLSSSLNNAIPEDCLPGREWYWKQQNNARNFVREQLRYRRPGDTQTTFIALERYSELSAVPSEMLKQMAYELDLHPYDLVTQGVSTLRLTVHDLHQMEIEQGVLSY